MELEEIRKQIDALDKQLLKILAERAKLVVEVAKYKNENGLPLKQPEREKLLIEKNKAIARELGLNEEFVENLCRLVIEESLRIEEEA